MLRIVSPSRDIKRTQHDALGQVTSGKKHWLDGTPVPRQQFEYGFGDIGNRSSTKAGGDQSGAGLRPATYTANRLNQYTSRTVPNAFSADYRRGEYFQELVTAANSSAPVWQSLSVIASLSGTNTTNSGSV